MLDLFRLEAESQVVTLTEGILALERASSPSLLESLMRAAHSLKGAARIVNLSAAVRISHVLEDVFVMAQKGKIVLGANTTDILLRNVDLLNQIAHTPESEIEKWSQDFAPKVDDGIVELEKIKSSAVSSSPQSEITIPDTASIPPEQVMAPEYPLETAPVTVLEAPVLETPSIQPILPNAPDSSPALTGSSVTAPSETPSSSSSTASPSTKESGRHFLRISTDSMQKILGLASESLINSHGLNQQHQFLLRIKQQNKDLINKLEKIREFGVIEKESEVQSERLMEALKCAMASQSNLLEYIDALESYQIRAVDISNRLYAASLSSRMRPFSEGLQAFPRMVRDLAKMLGKQIRLDIIGPNTPVDRELLEQLEAPLTHLIRNAVDHGVELPQDRIAVGKNPEGVITLKAHHIAGSLRIEVWDDGKGVDINVLREAIITKGLSQFSIVQTMHESELMEFLFLPGFSLKKTVTEISGRGVGLDILREMIKTVRGRVHVDQKPGRGLHFELSLPLSLSVLRSLIFEVGGEPYAIPLSQVICMKKVPRTQMESIEGRQFIQYRNHAVGLISAHQIFCPNSSQPQEEVLSIIIFESSGSLRGLVVDRYLGERELVLNPLDPLLGKVKDIQTGAIMDNGDPILLVDVDDLHRSIEKLAIEGSLTSVTGMSPVKAVQKQQKRVLVVDDSLTVRELEKKLLQSRGYDVDVAIDGVDGWNTVRTKAYDLLISDIDMPRMDGIQLVTMVKKDPTLRRLPVMIVSYKDREEDRRRGFEAGADYYLTKGSFHDQTLLQAVNDLIGNAQ